MPGSESESPKGEKAEGLNGGWPAGENARPLPGPGSGAFAAANAKSTLRLFTFPKTGEPSLEYSNDYKTRPERRRPWPAQYPALKMNFSTSRHLLGVAPVPRTYIFSLRI